jgi:hypothetical protein
MIWTGEKRGSCCCFKILTGLEYRDTNLGCLFLVIGRDVFIACEAVLFFDRLHAKVNVGIFKDTSPSLS